MCLEDDKCEKCVSAPASTAVCHKRMVITCNSSPCITISRHRDPMCSPSSEIIPALPTSALAAFTNPCLVQPNCLSNVAVDNRQRVWHTRFNCEANSLSASFCYADISSVAAASLGCQCEGAPTCARGRLCGRPTQVYTVYYKVVSLGQCSTVKISLFDNDGCTGSALTTTSVDSGKCMHQSFDGMKKMSSRYTCVYPATSAASTPLWSYPRDNGKWNHIYKICFHVLFVSTIALLG